MSYSPGKAAMCAANAVFELLESGRRPSSDELAEIIKRETCLVRLVEVLQLAFLEMGRPTPAQDAAGRLRNDIAHMKLGLEKAYADHQEPDRAKQAVEVHRVVSNLRHDIVGMESLDCRQELASLCDHVGTLAIVVKCLAEKIKA